MELLFSPLDIRAEDWHPLLRFGRAPWVKHCCRDSCDLPGYLKAPHHRLPPLPTRNHLLLRFLNVAATQEARSEQQLCQNFFFHQRVQLNDSSASNGSFHLLINQVAFGDGSELLALLPAPPFSFPFVHYNEGATCRNAPQSRKPKHPGLKICKESGWKQALRIQFYISHESFS